MKTNKEATGPKERFATMLVSEPYDSIIDLKDYSYEIIFESEEIFNYEVKVLTQNNNYFVITSGIPKNTNVMKSLVGEQLV